MKPKLNYSIPVKDRCQTPPYALDPLLPYLHEKSIGTIWEPAAGEGYLAARLEADYFDVLCSDITTGQNFLNMPPQCPYDAIVTNTPFTIKHKFVRRCYELDKPFALLMPVESIGTERVQKLMRAHSTHTGIMLLDHRINFKMPNAGWQDSSAQFPVLWLCYYLLPEPIVYGHINPVAYNFENEPPKGISKRMLPYQMPMFEGVLA